MPTLVLLSMQRSGTNWLMDLMNRLPGCLAMREVFNPNGVFGMDKRRGVVREALARRVGIPEITERTPEVVHWVRANPVQLLDLAGDAARAAGCPWLGITIFDEQLQDADLKAILARTDTRAVVLLRRQLPRFVSLVKAQTVGAWKQVDTTELHPRIEVDTFAEEAARARAWFGHLRTLLPPGVPRLTYEAHVLRGPPACLAALAKWLPDLVELPSGGAPEPQLVRQDRNDDVFAAVADGADLRRRLESAGLLDEALAYPWDEAAAPIP